MPLPVMTMPNVEDDIVLFQGGLDLTTPNLKIKPGHVRAAQNWQAVTNEEGGGYERTGGYERFTGQVSPSSVTYIVLMVSTWTLKPSLWASPDTDLIGVRLTGATSGAVTLLSVLPGANPQPKIGGGTYQQIRSFAVEDANDPLWEGQPYLIVSTFVSGAFQSGEMLTAEYFDIAGNYSAPWNVGVLASVGDMSIPLSARANARIKAIISDGRRPDMAPPPGSGGVLGVVSLVSSGVRTVYAWRNTADGTAAAIYKSSNAGWTAVPLYYEVRFTAGGATTPTDGQTLSQGAVTATIKRVVRESGSWADSNAAGRFVITAATGGNFSAGAGSAGGTAVTISGTQTAITLLPGGKYKFAVANFSGQLSSKRIYGADGVNRGFEFDGDVLVPIETKAAVDNPKFVKKHHNHLVLSIGSSLMISGPGTPYVFAAALGALEQATGDEVTGMEVQPGNQETAALAVFGRNSSGVLYGTSAASFSYKALATQTGSLPYMQGTLDQTYALDDRGVMSLAAAQEYGNFKQATMTANLGEFLNLRKSNAVMACVSTERSQLRLFFSDGSALYLTIVNGRLIGAMPQQFYQQFTCVWNAEDASGSEETFAGGTDGQVYKLDTGTSFDGAPISHFLVFTPNFMKAPSIKKVFRNANLEVSASEYVEFVVGYSLRYSSELVFQPGTVSVDNSLRAIPEWDSFIWDNFVWDGTTIGPIEIEIKGKSEVIQMIISGSSDYVPAFRLSSLTTHFNYTRRTR